MGAHQGDKIYGEIIAELQKQGWSVETTGNNHYRAAPPDKTKSLVVFSTTEDSHGQMNIVRDLKKRGFIWPIPSKNDAAGEARKSIVMRTTMGDLPELRAAMAVAHQWNIEEKAEAVPVTMPESQVVKCGPTDDEMDRIFRELKEARGLNRLAEDDVIACMKQLDEAQRALTKAQMIQRQTGDALKAKKAVFDASFAGTS